MSTVPARRLHRARRAEASQDFGQAGLSTARLPLAADVQFLTVMAADMPFIGGGWCFRLSGPAATRPAPRRSG